MTSDDRELLEAAAKAVGIEVTAVVSDGIPHRFGGGYWNPLTDDGDALRLAVVLKLIISPWGGTIYVNKSGANPVDAKEDFGPTGDPYAATRRAIVRAAAEVGRTK